MPDTNTSIEKLRQQVLVEFKQVLKLAPADYTENCTNVVMSMVQALLTERERLSRNEPVTIMGKSVDEICVILSALELERIADMKMTMRHLDDWMKLLREDYQKAMERATSNAIGHILSNPERGEKNE